jgi:hypothetical protein
LPLPQPGPIDPAPTTIAVLPLSRSIDFSRLMISLKDRSADAALASLLRTAVPIIQKSQAQGLAMGTQTGINAPQIRAAANWPGRSVPRGKHGSRHSIAKQIITQ